MLGSTGTSDLINVFGSFIAAPVTVNENKISFGQYHADADKALPQVFKSKWKCCAKYC